VSTTLSTSDGVAVTVTVGPGASGTVSVRFNCFSFPILLGVDGIELFTDIDVCLCFSSKPVERMPPLPCQPHWHSLWTQALSWARLLTRHILHFFQKCPSTNLVQNNYGMETDGLGFRCFSIILVLVLALPLSYTLFCGMSVSGGVLGY